MNKIPLLAISIFLILGCGRSVATTTTSAPPPPKATASPTLAYASPTPTSPPHCTVTAYILNFRDDPNTQASVLMTLEHETDVEIIGKDGDWYEVISPTGERGYVHSHYCKQTHPLKESKNERRNEMDRKVIVLPNGYLTVNLRIE